MSRRKTEPSPSKKPASDQLQAKSSPGRKTRSSRAHAAQTLQVAPPDPPEQPWWDEIDLDLLLLEEAPEPDPRDFYLELEDHDGDLRGRAA